MAQGQTHQVSSCSPTSFLSDQKRGALGGQRSCLRTSVPLCTQNLPQHNVMCYSFIVKVKKGLPSSYEIPPPWP